MNVSTESHLILLAVKGKALPQPSLLLARKFYIRKNKNKVNSIAKGRAVSAHLFPRNDQENCSKSRFSNHC